VAKGADCKSAGLRLRRFESYLPHQQNQQLSGKMQWWARRTRQPCPQCVRNQTAHSIQKDIKDFDTIGPRKARGGAQTRDWHLLFCSRLALFVPRMIRVVWPPKNVTALAHVVLAALLGARLFVVVALTQ
jgi:hypothetical protein